MRHIDDGRRCLVAHPDGQGQCSWCSVCHQWYRPVSDILEYVRPCSPSEVGTTIDLAKHFGYLDDKKLREVCRTLNKGWTKLRETKWQAKKMGLEVKMVD